MRYAPTKPIPTCRIPRLDPEEFRSYCDRYLGKAKKRLEEFKQLRNAGAERIFYELCFCVLTPQSKGVICDRVVAGLALKGVLRDPLENRSTLEEALKKTRFWRKKTQFIIKAWERFFQHSDSDIAGELNSLENQIEGVREMRNSFRDQMRGMGIGMKEASHFLRNIGYVGGLAIIDRHVISCLEDLGEIPDARLAIRSDRDYLYFEELMEDFSRRLGVGVEEMDLLLWSSKTGYIFK
jgi:N-glycosylase/DNA lyase